MVHHIDFNGYHTSSSSTSIYYNDPTIYPNPLSPTDPKKVTVVVRPEYWTQYSTPKNTGSGGWINGWKVNGFNMVYDYPVYGVNFDVTRCFISDKNLDVTKVISFLGDNIPFSSMDFSGKLHVGAISNVTTNRPTDVDPYDPKHRVKVYDNGKLLPDEKIAADGSLTLTFYNPNNISRKDLIGDHTIDVVYLYDVTFNCASANMMIEPEEIRNNEETDGDKATMFETFNYYNASAPVLESVRENSSVRFKVKLSGVSATEVRPMVKVGESVLSADEDGFYTLDVTDGNVDVNVYAVPVNGATLNPAEVDVINPAEAKDVTSIALAGEIEAEKVMDIIEQLPALEQLDLSGLSVALPADAMAGKETLVTVVLPNASDIEAGTFSGCTNLTNVQVPECVDYIGENAFKGCTSLKSLSFTGIKAVGANAFNGCSNLTSVIFTAARPDSQPARVRRRAESSRPDSYSGDAFAGINPNCIVYLDENVETPEAKANYVRVRKDESSADGRVYEALGSIALDPAYNFEALNTFFITESNTISMEMPLESSTGSSNWKSLVLPFSPDKVINAAGGEMSQFNGYAVSNDNGVYMAASIDTETGGELKLMNGIRANTPYIVSLYKDTEAGTVRFEAGQCEVPQTPSEIRVSGSEYDLVATLSDRELPAATTYLLSGDGSAFVSEGTSSAARAAETTQVAPFSVYATAEAGSSFPIDIDTTPEIPTGIDDMYNESGIKTSRENGMLVIYSGGETEIEVFGIDGLLIKILRLTPGRNVIEDLTPGVYVISGEKVII